MTCKELGYVWLTLFGLGVVSGLVGILYMVAGG